MNGSMGQYRPLSAQLLSDRVSGILNVIAATISNSPDYTVHPANLVQGLTLLQGICSMAQMGTVLIL